MSKESFFIVCEIKHILFRYFDRICSRIHLTITFIIESVNLHKLVHEILASEVEVGIGFLAGQVFNVTIKEEKSLTQLKNLLNQNENILLMAIGWLARENKVLWRFDLDEIFIRSIE